MGIVINPESEYAKELHKWNTPKREGGYGANGYEAYPRMLYKAMQKANGQYACMEMPPPRWSFPGGIDGDNAWGAAIASAEAFTAACQMTVRSEDEERQAKNSGWRNSPIAALDFAHQVEKDIANAAAEANFAAMRMSEKAQTERKKRDADTHKHVPE